MKTDIRIDKGNLPHPEVVTQFDLPPTPVVARTTGNREQKRGTWTGSYTTVAMTNRERTRKNYRRVWQ
jgi:hypothetical protein